MSDARDAFDFFVLHPYDFTVDDDARIRLAERARKTVHELRAAAPDKQVAITEYGFLFGGGTLLNAIVTADMTRMAIEEQLSMCVRHILIETDATGPFADSAAIGPCAAAEGRLLRRAARCRRLQASRVSVAGSGRRRHAGRAADARRRERARRPSARSTAAPTTGRRATCASRCRRARFAVDAPRR